MNPVIPEPAADAPIIDWAKPVTRALTALTDKRGAAARNERGAALPKLRPWEIHFFPAQTQEDEDFWGVYLPVGSLNVAGEEVTPTDSSGTGLVAAGAAYPGYYVIPVASGTSPSAFWLHVYTSEGTGGTSYRATVGASATANAGSGEETLTSIRLCSITSSGAIIQLIVGAIALGGGGDSGEGGECIRPWDIRYFDDEECWGVYLPSLDVDYGNHCAELNVSGTEVVPKDYDGRVLSAVDADEHPGYFIVPLGNDGEEGEEEGEVAAPTAFWLHVFVYKCYDPVLAEYLAGEDSDPDPVAVITPSGSAAIPDDALSSDFGYGTWELLTKIRVCDVDSEKNVIQYVAGEIDLTQDDIVGCDPFAVRWNALLQRWMVFLPDVENLVYFSDAPVEIEEIDGSGASGLAIYGGWYWFGFESAASAIYLVVTVTDATGTATAEISPEPGTAESGETVYNLLVATMETDQETGAKSVNQLITGAVALGGGGGGSTPIYPTVDDPSVAVQSISIVPLSGTVDQYDTNHRGAIKIVSGNLVIGDGTNGTTEGELYFDEEYATEYIDTVPISSVVVSNALTY